MSTVSKSLIVFIAFSLNLACSVAFADTGSAADVQNGLSVCVLNYERNDHPFSEIVSDLFENKEHIHLVKEAKPIDFLKCIEDNYSEIVLVVHSLEISNDPRTYFAYLSPSDLKAPTAAPSYNIQPFLQNIFIKARDYLRVQRRSGIQTSLHQIRFLSCDPEKAIADAYPALSQLMLENKVHLDISPAQNLVSMIHGSRVSTMDKVWLGESLQDYVPTNETGYFYCYMQIDTTVVYQTGKGHCLHGKYFVELNGAAIGLSSDWSLVFIKYEDLENLKIDHQKNIYTPTLNLSVALWANVELAIAPKPFIDGLEEINSIGVSLGLFSQIKVTRKY